MTARELLIAVLQQTSTDFLDARFEFDAELGDIADEILTSRDEETLNSAADDYEALVREQHPGVIYGAICRIRAYKVGAFLRARAEQPHP
jgi:hypothetical protein